MRQAGHIRRSKWPAALIVSILVHGLAIVALGFWSAPQVQPPDKAIRINLVEVGEEQDEEGGGDVTLVSRPHPKPAEAPAAPNNPAGKTMLDQPHVAPVAGTLNSPFHDPGHHQVAGQGIGPGVGQGAGKGSFFNVPVRGRRVVYVIDCSGSMGKNGALAVARMELARSLTSLPSDVHFQVIVYNDFARALVPGRPGWLQPTPALVQEAIAALLHLPAEGATHHPVGLRAGLQCQPDALYFLTDADDLTADHLRLALQLNPRNQTTIHTIELTLRNVDRPAMPMQVLARLTGGQYQAVDLAKHR